MTKTSDRAARVSSLLLLLLSACARAPEGWAPVLEQTSVAFLRTEIERVNTRVEAALAAVRFDPERASSELEVAAEGLGNLLSYYLPVLEARELAQNAYRHHYLGETQRVRLDIERIETLLIGVAEQGDSHRVAEMEEPLEQLEDARLALEADAEQAAQALEALASRLNSLLVKGGLVLAE